MKVYFIRHGQSLGNATRMHSTWLQVPLTEKGQEDARKAGQLIRDIPFDKIYTSDLIRTIQTCEIALPGREYESLEMLREIHVGNLLGRYVDDCIAEYGQPYLENRRKNNFLPYGGESNEMLAARVREFLTMMENSTYENVAVFGHAVYIHGVLDVITGFYHDKLQVGCNNGSVSVFEFRDGLWRVNGWNIRSLP